MFCTKLSTEIVGILEKSFWRFALRFSDHRTAGASILTQGDNLVGVALFAAKICIVNSGSTSASG